MVRDTGVYCLNIDEQGRVKLPSNVLSNDRLFVGDPVILSSSGSNTYELFTIAEWETWSKETSKSVIEIDEMEFDKNETDCVSFTGEPFWKIENRKITLPQECFDSGHLTKGSKFVFLCLDGCYEIHSLKRWYKIQQELSTLGADGVLNILYGKYAGGNDTYVLDLDECGRFEPPQVYFDDNGGFIYCGSIVLVGLGSFYFEITRDKFCEELKKLRNGNL